MDYLTKHFAHGKIVYRLPNVIEGIRLLGRIGLTPKGLKDDNEYVLMANLMEATETFVVEIDATIKGEKVTTWEKAIACREFADPITDLCWEIWKHVQGSDEKKEEAPAEEPS